MTHKPRNVLLLSTQRTGSTFTSDLICKNFGLTNLGRHSFQLGKPVFLIFSDFFLFLDDI